MQFSISKLRNILEDEDDPYSFCQLDARSENFIDKNKLDKVVHGAVKDIFLHLLKETLGQIVGTSFTFKHLQSFMYLVGKQVQLLNPIQDDVVVNATMRKGLRTRSIMHNRQNRRDFILLLFTELTGKGPVGWYNQFRACISHQAVSSQHILIIARTSPLARVHSDLYSYRIYAINPLTNQL